MIPTRAFVSGLTGNSRSDQHTSTETDNPHVGNTLGSSRDGDRILLMYSDVHIHFVVPVLFRGPLGTVPGKLYNMTHPLVR